jgi:hypothetical protein
MARPGISKKEVFSAANELVGQGIEPTIDQIRAILGTGSNSTIAGFLREWRSLRVKTEGVPLNDDLPAEITGLMKGLWQRVLTQSQTQIEALERESGLAMENVKSELAQLRQAYAMLQQQYEQQKKEQNMLLTDKIVLEGLVQKQTQETITLQSEKGRLLIKLEEKETFISEMRRLHKQTQENLEHFRESARVQYVTEQEKHAQQIQQIELTLKIKEEALAISENEKIALQLQLEKLYQENKSVTKLYDDAIYKFNTLSERYKVLEKVKERQEHDVEHWQQQLNNMLSSLEEQKRLQAELQQKNAILEIYQTDVKRVINDLKEQNKLITLEKWELAQEKARLEGENKQIQKMLEMKSIA